MKDKPGYTSLDSLSIWYNKSSSPFFPFVGAYVVISDITLPTKVHLVKAMVFPVVMYGCESWTIKKSEHWRIDAFELWCWRFLRIPWTARRYPKGNQSWIFIGRTDVEPDTPILWPPDAKNGLTWKDPDAGKDWRQERERDDRGWDGWMALLTQWTWV